MSCMDPARKICQTVCSIVFLAMGVALVAAPAQGGVLPHRILPASETRRPR